MNILLLGSIIAALNLGTAIKVENNISTETQISFVSEGEMVLLNDVSNKITGLTFELECIKTATGINLDIKGDYSNLNFFITDENAELVYSKRSINGKAVTYSAKELRLTAGNYNVFIQSDKETLIQQITLK